MGDVYIDANSSHENISWKSGDKLIRSKFGIGVVLDVIESNILEVKFDDWRKIILESHQMVSKM